MGVSLSIIEAGTIGNYSDLVSKVAAWMDRDDLEPQIPDFVAICEARLNRLLRTVLQEVQTLWVVGGETYSLPDDFRKLRSIWIDGSPDRPLFGMSPGSVPRNFTGTAGTTQAYYIEGRTISFAPPPADSTTFRANYWTRIPPLTSASPQNWLLTEHPDVYLWGTILGAAEYIRDQEAIDYSSAKLDTFIAEIQRESRNDQWASGNLAPCGPKQVRGGKC